MIYDNHYIPKFEGTAVSHGEYWSWAIAITSPGQPKPFAIATSHCQAFSTEEDAKSDMEKTVRRFSEDLGKHFKTKSEFITDKDLEKFRDGD